MVAIALMAAPAAIAGKQGPGLLSVTGTGWSQAPTRWQIAPDGSIDSVEGDGFAGVLPITIVTRKVGPAPDRYHRIRDMLEPAHGWMAKGEPLPCRLRAADGTGGVVRWDGRQALAYYSGCADPAGRAALEGIEDATKLIRQWTADAPIVARRRLLTDDEVRAVTAGLDAR